MPSSSFSISSCVRASSLERCSFLFARSFIPFSPAFSYMRNSLFARHSLSLKLLSPLPCCFLNSLSATTNSAGGGWLKVWIFACRPSKVAFVCNSSAEDLVWRAKAPCWVCSSIRMLVWSSWRCVLSRSDALFMRRRRASCSSCGKSWIAVCWSVLARAFRSEIVGGFMGSAILHGYSATALSWTDRASAMDSMFEMKTSMSPDRISRSESGTWPYS